MTYLNRLNFQMFVIDQGWLYTQPHWYIDDSTTHAYTLNTRGFICSMVEQVSGKWELTVVNGPERYSMKGNLFVASCLFVNPFEAVFAAYEAVEASERENPWKPYPHNWYF